MKRRFICVWYAPTYWPNTSIETLDTIEDENRGFGDELISKINKMQIRDVIKFDDLIIIRMDDDN